MAGTLSIDPQGIYAENAVARALGIPLGTLREARRSRRLRFSRKGKRVLFLGQWLIDWMQDDTASEQGGISNAR
jgi:hypothetical protein